MAHGGKIADGPIVARSHQLARRSRAALDIALNPWPTVHFPTEADYGIDGDVKLTEDSLGKMAVRVLPFSFQFQLKSASSPIGGAQSLGVSTAHLRFWLRHNVPTILFLVVFEGESNAIYWKCMNAAFLEWLKAERPLWESQATVTVAFNDADGFDPKHREVLMDAVVHWNRARIGEGAT